MQNILLIISITLLIFQMIVLAVDIDIGSPAIDRNTNLASGWTAINVFNPANASGTVTSVEIWASGVALSGCEVATFYVVSGNNLSTRDTEYIGDVPYGSKQTFEVDIDVQEGDYLGIYFSGGAVERNTSGYAGIWYINGDQIPCTDVTFSVMDGDTLSLYGTGTTEEEEEEANAIFFGCNF